MPPKKRSGEVSEAGDAFRLIAEKLKNGALTPNVWGYRPHPKQVVFHSSESKAKLYIGGNRSGKTTGGVVEDIWWLTGRHPYRPTPPPPVRGRVVSVDFLNGVEKIVRPEVARWIPPSDLLGGSWSTAYNKELRTLTLENGSFLEFMSYDQELEKFAGTSRHFIHFDEEPPNDVWMENKARLIDTNGSWWMTMTPVEGMEWIYDDVYLPGKTDPTASGITVVEVDMTENPYLSADVVDSFIAGLSEDDKKIRVKGEFVKRGGLVYPMFSEKIHVIDPIGTPPYEWEWFASMDHGLNNPTAWLWHAVSPDNRVVTFAEHYESQQLINYHAERVHEINKKHGRAPDVYIGDPSIRNRDPITGTSIHLEYAKRNIPILLGNNDVPAGIERVRQYLALGADQRPNWVITRDCRNLIHELTRLRWKSWASKRTQGDNNAKEEIHKKNDHASDSARYFFMSRPDLTPERFLDKHPRNPLNFPSYDDQPLRAGVVDAPERQSYTEWTTETQTDEVMGGIW